MKRIYLDNAATTRVAPEVLREMEPYFNEKYGNASSLHSLGSDAKDALEKARKIIAKQINANPREIAFTSGGTESNNFAIKGIAFANKDKGKHIITCKVDHDCVLNACKWLETQGFQVSYLDVDKEGFVRLDDLKKAVRKDTILVSIIHGNNEIGTIQDLGAIGKICRENNVYFHTDACQSLTKTEIDVRKQNLTLVTLNAHKIHGPKGVGALYIREGTKIDPLLSGGGQEFKYRSGTENIPGIVGFARSASIITEKDKKRMEELRDRLIKCIEDNIENVKLNGPRGKKRLCNNVNFSFFGVEGEAIGMLLDAKGVCSSTGSACSSKSLEPSHVLTAIGLGPEKANSSVRLSLGKYTTKEEIDDVVRILPEIIKKLRKVSIFEKIVNKLTK